METLDDFIADLENRIESYRDGSMKGTMELVQTSAIADELEEVVRRLRAISGRDGDSATTRKTL